MNRILIVIPARYGSTRLPGKPLIEIAGKPVVQHVWEKCRALNRADVDVVVATDDERIVKAVHAFGGTPVMTDPKATCGTDRMAELAARWPGRYRAYINVQGDEPLVRSADIDKLIRVMEQPGAEVGTLYHSLPAHEAPLATNVKVVTDRNGRCLYFSRSQIPFDRDGKPEGRDFKKHVGLYGFTPATLSLWSQLPEGTLEQREMLEQLRLLEAGVAIYATEIEPTGPGVDTPESLAQVRAILEGVPVQPPHDPWADVRLVVLDVDGVLTDGTLTYHAEAPLSKTYHARDGLGIAMLQAAGVPVGILTGRRDAATAQRLQALSIREELVSQGRHDKRDALAELAQQAGVPLEQIVYMGDDVIDLGAFEVAGLTACPSDASEGIRQCVQWVSGFPGGRGAVRELAERILRARGEGTALDSAKGFEALMSRGKTAQ